MDIALWGAGDLIRDRVELQGTGTFGIGGVCNTATNWDVDFEFTNGLTMKFAGAQGKKFPREQEWRQRYGEMIQTHGTAFEGTDGWVHVNRGNISMSPESLIDIAPETFKEKLVQSSDHAQNFLTAVKTRKQTVSPIESAVLADAFCHIPNIMLQLQRKLTYDVKDEKFVKDDEANQRLKLRSLRAPWKV
jgi:hypothetical protein